jgi:hypothetical protein
MKRDRDPSLFIPLNVLLWALILLVLSECSNAQAEDWTATDTALQVAVTAALFADYKQTEEIAHDPRYHETNPLLGSHPDPERVRNYFLGSAVAAAGVSVLLPHGTVRSGFQTGVLALEIVTIGHNKRIGLAVKF